MATTTNKNKPIILGKSFEFQFDDVFGKELNESDDKDAAPVKEPIEENESIERETESAENAGEDGEVEEEFEEDEEEQESLPKKAEDGSFAVNFDERGVSVSLADFDLQYCIGKGGYGKVLLVKKKDSDVQYAMKVLKKDFLIRTRNVSYTKTERDILRRVRHPFIVSLHYAFQTLGKVYLVMDFLPGGQLLFHLRKEAMFSEAIVKFYAAEILLAIDHLHTLGVIHRDLKPENILMDAEGHVCITDFGLSKDNMQDPNARTRTWCGTVEYMAPEMISGGGYGKAADWWSFGILVYDMLCGGPPFQNKNINTLQQKILNEKIKWPAYLTREASSLLRGLLTRDPAARLGSGAHGVSEIKQHPWFRGTRWMKMLEREVSAPYQPPAAADEAADDGKDEVRCFDAEYTDQTELDTPCTAPALSSSQSQLFKGFSYVRTPVDDSLLAGSDVESDDDD